MNQLQRHIFIPATLICVFVLASAIILLNKPGARRSAPTPPAKIDVSVVMLNPQNLAITIQSYGLLEPLTQSSLVSRVAGEIIYVDESFREGGFFKKGQELVRIDDADYLIELDIARSQVAEAQSRLINEQALAQEARFDWKRSGRDGEPPALAVREPQLKAAEAALTSAKASLARAELNLSRTVIRAPYNGRIRRQIADLGQVVPINATLAEIYSSEAAEVSLPIKNLDLPLIKLPQEGQTSELPNASLHSTLAPSYTWPAKIVRTAGAIDDQSRQLHVVARIDKPFTPDSSRPPLKIGEYLLASIEGITLENVISIPVRAIYQGNYVYIYEEERIYRREIQLGWSDERQAIVESGLQEGEKVVITALGQVASGTPAQITNDRQNDTATDADEELL